MHSDFNISSGHETPKASIFYSRYLSLNDVRNREEEDFPILRCASLQWLSDKEKSLVMKRSKNMLKCAGRDEKFETALKLLNAQKKKNKEEGDQLQHCESIEKELEKYSEANRCENEGEDNDRVEWCMCSIENINYSTNSRVLSRKSNSSRRMKNVMSTLNEEVPAETRCERCHLEIRDETRKKEKIIELWMQFFG